MVVQFPIHNTLSHKHMYIFLRVLLNISLIVGLANLAFAQIFDGYALYNEQNRTTAYLIDASGNIAHRWNCSTSASYAMQMKENGNIVRGAVASGNQLNGAAVGGMVQELDSLANVVWEFRYSSASYVSHHDLTVLPNGNVLLIAWEVKNRTELDSMGFTGNNSSRWPTHIVEVQQDGTNGRVVWEWHLWDHMIQDVDSTKANFGVVSEHPELLDINVTTSGGGGGGPGGRGGDWFHVNGIDYNEELDQIAFSSRYLSEIFIIDHSTTTAEAASHTGGNSGKGGDFLFRWGKPSNYGATGPQLIDAAVHDVRWIDSSAHHNFGGYLQIFNNEGAGRNRSAVDAFLPQRAADGYNYVYNAGVGFEPTISYDYRHTCITSNSGQSASNRMPNGNLFVNVSRSYMYEVDSLENLVWQYSAGPAKAFRYTCDFPGIIQLLNDPCGVTTSVENELNEASIMVGPNPSRNAFYLKIGSSETSGMLTGSYITDLHGRVVKRFSNDVRSFDLSSEPGGIYYLHLNFGSKGMVSKKLIYLGN